MEHEDTAVKLRAGFSKPLHDSVRTRLVADGIDEATAESAADAIVGGVVYPILSGAQRYSRPQGRTDHPTHRRVSTTLPARDRDRGQTLTHPVGQ